MLFTKGTEKLNNLPANRSKLTKDTGLATEAVDYIHEPVLMHYVLGFFKQFPVPHVLVVRLVLHGINHCGGRERNTLNLWII